MLIERGPELLLLLALIAVSASGVACSKNFVEPETAAKTSTLEGPGAGTSAPRAGAQRVHFKAPAGWVEQQPSSSMRKAQYLLPQAEGDPEDAELVVYHFPGQGGSISSNLSRWVGQMSRPDGSPASDDAQVSERQVRGKAITLLDVGGTYRGMMGPRAQGKAKPGFRMLGAIVDTRDGPWFFKLTGPAATVAKWSVSWDKFVESFQVY